MINTIKIIKLNFTSPLHIGEIGIGLEESGLVLHSDTIFNAICNALAKLRGNKYLLEFIEKSFFEKEISFKISSGFPFVEDILYFPKPKCAANISREHNLEIGKYLKKIQFLPKELFEKWISQSGIQQNDLENLMKFNNFMDFEKVYSGYQKDILPKVSIDRENKNSEIYFLGSFCFKGNSGIWFMVDCDEDVYKNSLLPALRLLSHEGFGGKRTLGYGNFEMKEEKLDLNLPESSKSNANLMMSLYSPSYHEKSENELFCLNKSSWRFLLRGGYALPYGSMCSYRKPQRLLITEGSIFEKRHVNDKPIGQIIKDSINSSGSFAEVYHYGVAYSLPVVVVEGEYY